MISIAMMITMILTMANGQLMEAEAVTITRGRRFCIVNYLRTVVSWSDCLCISSIKDGTYLLRGGEAVGDAVLAARGDGQRREEKEEERKEKERQARSVRCLHLCHADSATTKRFPPSCGEDRNALPCAASSCYFVAFTPSPRLERILVIPHSLNPSFSCPGARPSRYQTCTPCSNTPRALQAFFVRSNGPVVAASWLKPWSSTSSVSPPPRPGGRQADPDQVVQPLAKLTSLTLWLPSTT